MKLEKLLTLSQFIDNMRLNGIGTEPETIDLVFNYNDFLKQPITKGMFVNPYSRPMHIMARTYSQDRSIFEDAEKKVIFDGYMDGVYYINDNGRYHFYDMLINIKTLHDLAESTKGELSLKNANI